ncbi:1-acylglycerol-3-phosphate O-acyltransferase PNPLA3 isoform X2 [Erinaceus europaeus]|uniref:1-acylglycerol-3-phosphate O-acyltransferase PNPLA3 isoform X2 n=1 Tax=Erinaceus europaeus TaxID=9365 RepID=A0ABM3X8F6_ERIEU|nr:1-acylglycerol-3-phosphate O-acyltransferase PNPLA3 isoform X2 [Erinaceus europaeus]
MYDVSFSGCGLLGIYYVGVTQCLSERAPHLLQNARMLLGASAGALHSVTVLCGIPIDTVLEIIMTIVQTVKIWNIGILHPSLHISKYLRKRLSEELPDNVHQLTSGKLCISLTRVSDGKNVLVSDFESKDEVVDALVCSSFIPFFTGLIPPTFRGEQYIDGGSSNNMPFFDAKTTITVSPFYGEIDICPKVKSTNFSLVEVNKFSLRLCLGNIYLLTKILLPSELKVLGEICLRGYLDAFRFLEENGICEGPQPGPTLRSAVSGCPAYSAVSGCPGSLECAEAAAPEIWPEGDELLDHLRHSIQPWDESILDILSPRLILALREVIKKQSSYKDYIVFPVKVLSYAVLPFTLPVESAITMVQRLMMWLPSISSNIQWLQWATSQVCCQVMKRLLPSLSAELAVGDHR